jgi:hypothetical protein
MKKIIQLITAAGVLAASSLSAQNIVSYGWEDGGTILGLFGNVANPQAVASGTYGAQTITPFEGSLMLQVQESPEDETPQAYVAAITGLADGDVVTASFYGWSHVDGGSPSMRIWGHYATTADILGYNGSAGGNNTYTAGDGAWSQVSHSWTFDSDSGARDALVIEARLYSPAGDEPLYWVDSLVVEAPMGATIITPVPEPATYAALAGLLALGLVIVRRRVRA